MNKFRTKIVLVMLANLLIFAFVLLSISYNYSTKLIKKESDEKLIALMESYKNDINESFREREYATADLKTYFLNTFDYEEFKKGKEYLLEYKEFIDPVIKGMAQRRTSIWLFFNPFILNEAHDVWYYDYDKDGEVEKQIETSYEYYLEDIEDKEKEWFFNPMKTKKSNWTNYYDFPMSDGGVSSWVSHSDALYIDDEFIGVVGSDFDFASFKEQISSFSIYNTGYSMLMDSDYNIVIHPEIVDNINIDDFEGGRHSMIKDIIEEKRIGLTEYEDSEGKEFVMAYSKIINDWSLVVVAEKDEIYKSNKNYSIFIIVVTLISTIVMIIGIYIIGKKVSEPIEKLTENIIEIRDGDYSIEITAININAKSEVGILARTVESMRRSLNEAIIKINSNASYLESQVKERTLELHEANDKLNETINELKCTQSRLIENKKTEAISRMLIELSHKLNTPIGTIITAGTYLKKSIDNKEKLTLDNLTRAIDIIVKSATTSADIIDILKEVTDRKKASELETIKLSMFVRKRFDAYLKRNIKNIDIKTLVSIDDDIEFNVDINVFADVLNHLFLFSFNYKPDELGIIDIECSAVLDGDMVKIIYSDQGHERMKGIENKIFEPFAIKSFSNLGGGMELYIVQNLVITVLEGNIEFEIDDNGRFEFVITLPRDYASLS